MRFSKEKFLKNAGKTKKDALRAHLDILDGKEVEHDSMIRYNIDGEPWMLYPVEDAWCDK